MHCIYLETYDESIERCEETKEQKQTSFNLALPSPNCTEIKETLSKYYFCDNCQLVG